MMVMMVASSLSAYTSGSISNRDTGLSPCRPVLGP
jgi:hypothetical protein